MPTPLKNTWGDARIKPTVGDGAITHQLGPFQTQAYLRSVSISVHREDAADYTAPGLATLAIVLGQPSDTFVNGQLLPHATNYENGDGVQGVLFVTKIYAPATLYKLFGDAAQGGLLLPPGALVSVCVGPLHDTTDTAKAAYYEVHVDGWQLTGPTGQLYGRDPITRIGR